MRPETTIEQPVERLCSHHDTSSFDCGVTEWNQKLRYFQDKFEAGDKVLGFVAVDADSVVKEYVVLADTILPVPGTGRSVRCFTVPAMGIDKAHRHEHLFDSLVKRSMNAMMVRQHWARESGAPYRGLVSMPDNEALRRWLGWAGFKPFPGRDDLLWIELDGDDDGS